MFDWFNKENTPWVILLFKHWSFWRMFILPTHSNHFSWRWLQHNLRSPNQEKDKRSGPPHVFCTGQQIFRVHWSKIFWRSKIPPGSQLFFHIDLRQIKRNSLKSESRFFIRTFSLRNQVPMANLKKLIGNRKFSNLICSKPL